VILLDTTVLVYATGADHPLQAPCRRLVELIRDEVIRATTTIEVVQEYAHVRARRRPRIEAAERAREYARGLSPLARPEEDDLLEGLRLFESSPHLGPFDAVLAATAIRRGWSLASADRSFRGVERLRCLDPSSPEFLKEAKAG
jgi:hypothetical protein